MAAQRTDYSKWSSDSLIEKVVQLEQQLRDQAVRYNGTSPLSTSKTTSPPLRPKNSRVNRDLDPSKYSTRLIALKFAYLGQHYNGFEHHANNKTPLPTIEEELWKALSKARLIFRTGPPTPNPGEVNWEGCEYSKCGRTDKGVSAFGQVIGIRVRSNRPRANRTGEEIIMSTGEEAGQNPQSEPLPDTNGDTLPVDGNISSSSTDLLLSDLGYTDPLLFDHINDELPYVQILNRLLPADIRILAWCPTAPTNFSARFSCRERRYRYFFTQPAFAPIPGSQGFPTNQRRGRPRREGWLDIDGMREGASHFVGLHDFRNFCKVDPSKQLTNFERRIFHADIEALDPQKGPVGYIADPSFQIFEKPDNPERISNEIPIDGPPPSTPQVYTFTVRGSAFLWHQVRHMAAILFLIGQGLESPDLIPGLLDVKSTPTKPMYDMADDAPLVLWDCIFPREGSDCREDALEWVYVGDQIGTENGLVTGSGKGKYGMHGIVDDLWKVWRGRKIDEVLAGMLLDVVVGQGKPCNGIGRNSNGEPGMKARSKSQKLFDGGNAPRLAGQYVPVLQRPRMESVESINSRYAARKGLDVKKEVREDDLGNVLLSE